MKRFFSPVSSDLPSLSAGILKAGLFGQQKPLFSSFILHSSPKRQRDGLFVSKAGPKWLTLAIVY